METGPVNATKIETHSSCGFESTTHVLNVTRFIYSLQ